MLKKVLPSNNYEYYLCGPPPFMESVTKGCGSGACPILRCILKRSARPAWRSSPPLPPAAGAAAAPAKKVKVTFARSNKELFWTGDPPSLLDLGEKAGLALSSGCRGG